MTTASTPPIRKRIPTIPTVAPLLKIPWQPESVHLLPKKQRMPWPSAIRPKQKVSALRSSASMAKRLAAMPWPLAGSRRIPRQNRPTMQPAVTMRCPSVNGPQPAAPMPLLLGNGPLPAEKVTRRLAVILPPAGKIPWLSGKTPWLRQKIHWLLWAV